LYNIDPTETLDIMLSNIEKGASPFLYYFLTY